VIVPSASTSSSATAADSVMAMTNHPAVEPWSAYQRERVSKASALQLFKTILDEDAP